MRLHLIHGNNVVADDLNTIVRMIVRPYFSGLKFIDVVNVSTLKEINYFI